MKERKSFSFVPFCYAQSQTIESLKTTHLEKFCKESNPYSEVEVDSLAHLLDELPKEEDRLHLGLVFRGHSDSSWKIQSSFFRKLAEIGENYASSSPNVPVWGKADFSFLVESFKENLDLQNQEAPDGNQLLALMQHYGLPTPLIDFTESLDTALFFSFNPLPLSNEQRVAVFAIDVGKLHSFTFNSQDRTDVDSVDTESLKSNNFDSDQLSNGDLVRPSEFWDIRLSRQKALFMWQETPFLENFREFLIRLNAPKGTAVKFILPITEREKVLEYLKKQKITEETLFPDMEKIAKETHSAFCNKLLHHSTQSKN